MVDYNKFKKIVEEEMELLPKYVFDGLNGGVVVEMEAYPHPARLADDLYILGTYNTDAVLGHQIKLFYGSFMVYYFWMDEEQIRPKIRETLRHEFLHYLETKAGLFGKGSLVEEDIKQMCQYFENHQKKKELSSFFSANYKGPNL